MGASKKKHHALKIVSGVFFILLILILVAPWLPLHDPQMQNLESEFASPNAEHWLGTGENGVDVMSQLFWGGRVSLGVGIGSVFLSSIIGLVLGSISGWVRGRFDLCLMRIVDMIYAFPGLLLVVALAVVLGPSLKNVILVLVLTGWASYARLVRGITLSLREREFVAAAVSLGAKPSRVLLQHIWPNLLPPLIVQMTYGLGSAILTESSLSFLGLGAPVGTPSWGGMLSQGREVLTSAFHLVAAPGLALVACVLGLNLLGDALRDYLDPKLKWRS